MLSWGKAVAVVAIIVPLCGCMKIIRSVTGQVQGSGNAANEKRTGGDFDQIRLEGAIDCVVSVGKPASIEVRADDNLLALIETEIEGKTLVVSARKSFCSKNPIVVMI